CRQRPPTSGQEQLPGTWLQIRYLNEYSYFHDPARRVSTLFDPRHSDNAAIMQNAADRILHALAQRNISDDVTIVLGLTKGVLPTRKVTYYLVNNESQAIFWLEDLTRSTKGYWSYAHPIVSAYIRGGSFFLYQYWHHIQHFPPADIDVLAENDLLGKLLAAQIPGALSPWTPDECRHFIAAIKYNQTARSERDRMAGIGLLLSLIHHHQHSDTHGHHNDGNGRFRNNVPVLLDLDQPLGLGMAYSVMLTGVNKYQGVGGQANELFFLASLTAVTASLLLCFLSPGLCLFLAASIFEDPVNVRVRYWIVSCFMAFNIFVYGCLLNTFGGYLGELAHQPSMASLVLVTFVLALPPAFHALRLGYDLD
ncbi:hypothetical protein FRC01_000768, partial [Tulasnella sp. 417]